MSSAMTPEQQAQAAAFSADPRVQFNKSTNKWEYEDETTGKEYEWSNVAANWVPIVSDEELAAQQAAYSVAGVDENVPAAPILKAQNKKRKNDAEVDYTSNTVSNGTSVPATSKKVKTKAPRVDSTSGEAGPSNFSKPAQQAPKSTAVYITNLPLDATLEEIHHVFKKAGVILIDDQDQPRIKLYTDPKNNDMFRGEALVMYFQEKSVDLAITLLDDEEFRLGSGEGRMKVQKAEWGKTKSLEAQGGAEAGADGEAGESKAKENGGGTKKRMTDEEKRKASKRLQKLKDKVNDWDSASSDEERSGRSSTTVSRNARVVVLRYMFSLEDLEKDASLMLDLKEDVRDEAGNFGEVTNVILFDKEEDGIITVKFKDPLSAQACIAKFNGRFFDGRRVSASLHDGREKFKKSGSGMDADEDEEAEKARLENYRAFLEKEQ